MALYYLFNIACLAGMIYCCVRILRTPSPFDTHKKSLHRDKSIPALTLGTPRWTKTADGGLTNTETFGQAQARASMEASALKNGCMEQPSGFAAPINYKHPDFTLSLFTRVGQPLKKVVVQL